jgi:hypothetical protein
VKSVSKVYDDEKIIYEAFERGNKNSFSCVYCKSNNVCYQTKVKRIVCIEKQENVEGLLNIVE